MQQLPLFTNEYHFSHWADERNDFLPNRDHEVRQTLIDWNDRDKTLSESHLDGLSLDNVLRQLWHDWPTGTAGPHSGATTIGSPPPRRRE